MTLGTLRMPSWFDHGIGLLLCLVQVGLLASPQQKVQVGVPPLTLAEAWQSRAQGELVATASP